MDYGHKQTMEQGFNKFVIKNKEGCWGWSGCAPKNPGYGQFRYSMKKIRAHRASWIIHFGEIPQDMLVLHKCDNRTCSNPEHLFLGTDKDNLLDMIKKGRHPIVGQRGEKSKCSKLTNDQVLQIKELFKTENSNKKIANLFNVHPGTIGSIKYGRNWRSI